MEYRHIYAGGDLPDAENICRECLVWYCEYQKAALLLETLAEDHFPTQELFGEWIKKQIRLI